MIRKLLVLILMFWTTNAFCQDALVVKPQEKITVEYTFNNEWNYLSSDLYLFNADKIADMLNKTYRSNSKKKKDDFVIENILITTKITGTILGELSYPIFNFVVDNSSESMKTYSSDTKEAIRILDNLPLSSQQGKTIDAQINSMIIEKNNPAVFYDFVTSQLGMIASYSTPISAAKTLCGELGQLIKSKTTRTEYTLKSTVRLYEENDFNKKICSVIIYAFMPMSQSGIELNADSLKSYLAKIQDPKLDYSSLQKILNYKQSPIIVVVNYKSKYASEPVFGDQITQEYVVERKNRVQKSYENSLISSDIYNQELKLIGFLESFLKLKNSISNYQLNYNNKITDDFSRMFFTLLNDYRALNSMYQRIFLENKNDAIFKNEFKQTYDKIYDNAKTYLDADNNLKNIKNIGDIMSDYQTLAPKFNKEKVEKELMVLHSINFPDNENNITLTDLKQLIEKLENQLYTNSYLAQINKLKTLAITSENNLFCEKLKQEINASSCKICQIKAQDAINIYQKKLEEDNIKLAKNNLKKQIMQANNIIYNALSKEKQFQSHFDNDFPDGFSMETEFVYQEFIDFVAYKDKLTEKVKENYTNYDTNQINQLIEEIKGLMTDCQALLESLIQKKPNWIED